MKAIEEMTFEEVLVELEEVVRNLEAPMKAIEEMTFEEAFVELEGVVRKLEAGGLSLEESLALYERGQRLVAFCNRQLDQAELKVRQITPSGDLVLLEI